MGPDYEDFQAIAFFFRRRAACGLRARTGIIDSLPLSAQRTGLPVPTSIFRVLPISEIEFPIPYVFEANRTKTRLR